MTTLQKTVVATVLVIAMGAVAYETHQLNSSREHVATLEKEAVAARVREQRLREERNGLRQLSVPPAPGAGASTASAPDPGASEELKNFRQLMEAMPARWIPEMGLLSEKDWMGEMRQSPVEGEYQQRSALDGLRGLAKIRFADRMKVAIKAYTAATGGSLPGDLSQLLPYFDPPIDPAILLRYEILPAEPGTGTPPAFVVGERAQALVDDEFEEQMKITPLGTSPAWSFQSLGRTEKAFSAAMGRYHTNNSSYPGSFELLAPYLDATADPGLAREFFRLFQAAQSEKKVP
jgi:hypothetical protein